jgi:hypothetical protein
VLTREGRLLAAVLACGPGTALSHVSAAAFRELLNTAQATIDVTVSTRGGRCRRPGVRIHTTRHLDPRDVTEHNGIPITTVARTLVDLNAVVPERLVERALEQAYILRLLGPGDLEGAIERARGRKTGAIRRLIAAEHRASTVTRSELEERFLALIRRGGLPDPRSTSGSTATRWTSYGAGGDG